MGQKSTKPKVVPDKLPVKKTPQETWPWSPSENPNPLFKSENKETGEINTIPIVAAPSFINEDRHAAFMAVLTEQDYHYRLEWSPVVMRKNNSTEDVIVAMKSKPININKSLMTIIDWTTLLNDLLILKGVKVINCLDIAPYIGSFAVMVYDPQLLQAVDGLIERVLDLEVQEYIDDLEPLTNYFHHPDDDGGEEEFDDEDDD